MPAGEREESAKNKQALGFTIIMPHAFVSALKHARAQMQPHTQTHKQTHIYTHARPPTCKQDRLCSHLSVRLCLCLANLSQAHVRKNGLPHLHSLRKQRINENF